MQGSSFIKCFGILGAQATFSHKNKPFFILFLFIYFLYLRKPKLSYEKLLGVFFP